MTFRRGEKVLLVRVERGKWDNLDDSDFEIVSRRIGGEVGIVDLNVEGSGLLEVEWIEFIDGERRYTSLLVEPDWLKRAKT